MKTKFVIAETPLQEPVQELLLSLGAYGSDRATIMLHLPNGNKIPLVGVTTNGEGKLDVVRWSSPSGKEYITRDGDNRIFDRFGPR